jgi:hypothetical protein
MVLRIQTKSDDVVFKKTETKPETQPIKTTLPLAPRPNSLLGGLGTGAFGKNRMRTQG